MEPIVVTWPELLIAVVLVLSAYIAEVLLFMRAGKKSAPAEREGAPREVQALELEIDQLNRQIDTLRHQVETLKRGAPAASPVPPPGAETPASAYGQAAKLAEEGLDVRQVAASCGISVGEAELIVALHQRQLQSP